MLLCDERLAKKVNKREIVSDDEEEEVKSSKYLDGSTYFVCGEVEMLTRMEIQKRSCNWPTECFVRCKHCGRDRFYLLLDGCDDGCTLLHLCRHANR